MKPAAGIALIAVSLTGYAARLASKPGVFDTSGFRGATEQLLADLDDALRWIDSK